LQRHLAGDAGLIGNLESETARRIIRRAVAFKGRAVALS